MKTKFIVLLFMTLISFFAKAEKTYRNDHDVCTYKSQIIDIDLRSPEQYLVSEDDEYGQTVFLQHKNSTTKVDLRDMGIGRYRMLKLYNSLCHKILAISSKEEEVAFFFLKDNRPFADLGIILFYNLKTHETELVETNLPVRTAIMKDRKLLFKVAKKDSDNKYGTIQINNLKYHFVEKPIEPWVSFDGKNFKLDPVYTYEKFEYKKLLKKSDLDKLKDIKNAIYTIAVNPLNKGQCLSFNGGGWVCN